MSTVLGDVKYALRQLRQSPGFAAVAILSLALAIGANTAIFSVINGVLLKSLPVPNPEALRVIGWRSPDFSVSGLTSDSRGRTESGGFWMSFAYPTYREFAEQAEGFSDVFAFSFLQDSLTVRARGIASVAHGLMVSGNFFEGYGTRVLIGRPIRPEDDHPGADPVAIITYRFWRRHYDLDPQVLGQTFMVNNASFTIVGVLPRSHRGPLSGDPTDFYLPITAQPQILSRDLLTQSDEWWVRIMGRLEPGTNEGQARASLEALFRQTLATPGTHVDRPEILLEEGKRGLGMAYFGDPFVLMFLQALVGVVLLVACVNMASLLLSRGASRRHEMSVRAALGAGRWRLVRQSLAESLVLSLGAAAVALLLSVGIKAAITGSLTGLLREAQSDLEYMGNPSARIDLAQGIDGRVLLFTLGVGLLTTFLFGLLPALRAARVDPCAELKANAGRGAPRLRLGKMMVATQVALSMLLVTGGVLLTRTVLNLHKVDPGYDPENLLVFRLSPSEASRGWRNLAGCFDSVRAGIRQIPGVRSVALASVEGYWYTECSIPGLPGEAPELPTYIVSDGWLDTMGIPLLAGRDFTPADTDAAQEVVIVNKAFAREFFPDESVLGRLLETERGPRRIVGLCADHKRELRWEASPAIYFYTGQWLGRSMGFVVRSVLEPLSLVPAVRQTVAQLDPGIPLEGVTTQELRLKESLVLERTLAALCVSLALLTLGVCCIGLYGLMAYNVARRTSEIGVRMALGARAVDVAGPVLHEAAVLALAGALMGVPLALALGQVLSALAFGVAPHDPVTMIISGLILLAVATGAAWIPARRAARIDPMEALRYE